MGQGASVASWVDRSQAGQPQGKTPGKSQAAGPGRMGTVGIRACEVYAGVGVGPRCGLLGLWEMGQCCSTSPPAVESPSKLPTPGRMCPGPPAWRLCRTELLANWVYLSMNTWVFW